jgi:hypothetical protein
MTLPRVNTRSYLLTSNSFFQELGHAEAYPLLKLLVLSTVLE